MLLTLELRLRLRLQKPLPADPLLLPPLPLEALEWLLLGRTRKAWDGEAERDLESLEGLAVVVVLLLLGLWLRRLACAAMM